MKNVPMIFENHEVEIIEVNGQILFNPRHVGACLDITESSVRDQVSVMSDKQVIKLTNSIVGLTDFRKLHNTGENFLTEAGVYKLVFKSRKPEAEKFTDWVTDVVLPSIRKTGSFSTRMDRSNTEQFEMEMLAAKYTPEILRLSAVSTLKMIHGIYERNGIPTSELPVYVEKTRAIFSATKLLADNGKPFSASVFNAKMIIAGFMEEKERMGSKGIIKTFKSLTDKAVNIYGQNDTNLNNPLETQPHYYEDSFEHLLSLI